MILKFRIAPVRAVAVPSVLALIVLSVRCLVAENDFNVYLHAGVRLLAGENPYLPPHHHGLHYYYSPFFACVMAVFQQVPVWTSKAVWWLISLLCLVRSASLILRWWNHWPFRFPMRFMGWLLLVSTGYCLANLWTGQLTIFLLWSILETERLTGAGKSKTAALILGTAAQIKIIPVLFLFWLLQTGKWKTTVYSIFWMICLTLLPALFVGWNQNLSLTASWWEQINPLNGEHAVNLQAGFLDAGSLIAKYCSDTVIHGEQTTALFHLSPASVAWLTLFTRIFILASVLFFSGRLMRGHSRFSHIGHKLALCGLLAAIPVLFPHQRFYSFLFTVPALLFVGYFLSIQSLFTLKQKWFSLIATFAMFILLAPFAGTDTLGPWLSVWNDYRLFSLGGILLLPIYYSMAFRACKAEVYTWTAIPGRPHTFEITISRT
ncbi:MAG: DUF2029 domain-containing protein [Bacteroidetes bacterium]|nr:DUF2029 domain-containing protein [Bacteroidota bacterium]